MIQRIKEAGLKLKLENCNLFQEEVIILGHRVTKDGVLPGKQNVERILNSARPSNVNEVRQFLGTASKVSGTFRFNEKDIILSQRNNHLAARK